MLDKYEMRYAEIVGLQKRPLGKLKRRKEADTRPGTLAIAGLNPKQIAEQKCNSEQTWTEAEVADLVRAVFKGEL